MPNAIETNQKTAEIFRHSWGWMLGIGILLVILGTIGLGMAVGLTIISMIFFGVLLIIAGVVHAADVFRHRGWRGAAWQALIGALYIIGGIVVIYDPILASTILTAVLAVALIIIGLIRLMMAILFKDIKGWGWVFLAGLAALVLGILILVQWPVSGLWFIGLFIAIEIMITGWTYILMGLAMRTA